MLRQFQSMGHLDDRIPSVTDKREKGKLGTKAPQEPSWMLTWGAQGDSYQSTLGTSGEVSVDCTGDAMVEVLHFFQVPLVGSWLHRQLSLLGEYGVCTGEPSC